MKFKDLFKREEETATPDEYTKRHDFYTHLADFTKKEFSEHKELFSRIISAPNEGIDLYFRNGEGIQMNIVSIDNELYIEAKPLSSAHPISTIEGSPEIISSTSELKEFIYFCEEYSHKWSVSTLDEIHKDWNNPEIRAAVKEENIEKGLIEQPPEIEKTDPLKLAEEEDHINDSPKMDMEIDI